MSPSLSTPTGTTGAPSTPSDSMASPVGAGSSTTDGSGAAGGRDAVASARDPSPPGAGSAPDGGAGEGASVVGGWRSTGAAGAPSDAEQAAPTSTPTAMTQATVWW